MSEQQSSYLGIDSVAIILPCKNEAGNIPKAVDQFLQGRRDSEQLWLVEGGSSDSSEDLCRAAADQYSDQGVRFARQVGKGKLGAILTVVRSNPEALIAIWDGDISVDFTDVQRAIDLATRSQSFVAGDRFVHEIETGAMPGVNKIGNRVITKIAAFVYSAPITDALCGTKVFPAKILLSNQKTLVKFMEGDTFGDLSYFLAAKLNGLKIEMIDTAYKDRVYGNSELHRFSNGIELLISLFKSFFILKDKGRRHV